MSMNIPNEMGLLLERVKSRIATSGRYKNIGIPIIIKIIPTIEKSIELLFK